MHSKSRIGITGIDVYDIAFHPEIPVVKVGRGSSIKALHQAMQQFGAGNHLVLFQGNDVLLELHRVSNAI